MFTRAHLERLETGSLVDICRVHDMSQAGAKAALLERICTAVPAVRAAPFTAAAEAADQPTSGTCDVHAHICLRLHAPLRHAPTPGGKKRRLSNGGQDGSLLSSSWCAGGKLVFDGPQASVAVLDGLEVELDGHTWRASCATGTLRLTRVLRSNNRRSRRAQLIEGVRTELARRRQELEDLRVEQTQLLDQVEDGANGEGDFDNQNQQLKCITLARKAHKARIEELEIMVASGVGQTDVTFTEASTTVCLTAGELAAPEHVAGGAGGLVWCPGRGRDAAAVVSAAVVEERKTESEMCEVPWLNALRC